ncbi:MAG: PAS domain-containing sensor histidine kinase [Deferrisomatales bacterium]
MATVLVAGFLLWNDYRRSTRQLEARARQLTELTGRVLAHPLWSLDREEIDSVVSGVMADPDLEGALVEDAGGVLAARWKGPRAPIQVRSTAAGLVRRTAIRRGEEAIGTLSLYFTLGRLRREVALKVFFACLLIGLGGWIFAFYGEFLFRQWLKNRRVESRLARRETQVAHMLDALGLALYVARPDGTVEFKSAGWKELAGAQRGPLRWGDWVHPEDREAALGWFAGLSGETRSLISTEYRVRGEDPETRWVRDCVRPVPGRSGPRLYGILADVTDHRLAQERHRTLEARLAQSEKLESLGRLAGGVAHDFNNLIQVTTAHLDELARGASGQESVRAIRDALGQARRLVQNLLGFARSEVSRREEDLVQVVHQCAELTRPLLGPDLRLEVSLPAEPLRVWMAPTEIQRALLNLLFNARDAVGDRGTVQVLLDAEPPRGTGSSGPTGSRWARLEVADDGPGISEADLPRVFDPFFTTKPQGTGTGLGLATAQRIVHLHGGTVEVETAPGRGSTFRLFLPLAAPAAEPKRAARPRERLVLVADDEAVQRQAFAAAVREAGCTPVEAADGEEAFRLFAERPEAFQVAVLDLDMPRWDGLRVAQEVGIIRPDLPVILVTGAAEFPEGHTAAQAAAVFFKPFDPAELARAVQRVAGGGTSGK